MQPIDIDTHRFPLVIVSMRGTNTDAEFDEYLRKLHAVYQRRQRFALVMDASRHEGSPAAHRKKQADWLSEHAMMVRSLNVGTAFVLPSAMQRGMLTAILWLSPLPSPHGVFETVPEGIRWAQARLREEGLSVPRNTAEAPSL